MSETQTPENNVTPIDQAPTARFNADVDQAMGLTAPTELPVPQESPAAPVEAGAEEASPVPAEKKVRVGRLAALAAAGAVVGTALFGSHGNAEEKPVEQPTVQIEAPESGTAWDLAREVKDDDVSQREVSNAIGEQADAQGYPGVEAGEVYTLPDELVSEEAEKELTPEQPVPPVDQKEDT